MYMTKKMKRQVERMLDRKAEQANTIRHAKAALAKRAGTWTAPAQEPSAPQVTITVTLGVGWGPPPPPKAAPLEGDRPRTIVQQGGRTYAVHFDGHVELVPV